MELVYIQIRYLQIVFHQLTSKTGPTFVFPKTASWPLYILTAPYSPAWSTRNMGSRRALVLLLYLPAVLTNLRQTLVTSTADILTGKPTYNIVTLLIDFMY